MKQGSSQKITIIGPGAMGCLLAATLSKHGCEITLLDYKPERAHLIKTKGITVHSFSNTFTFFPEVITEYSHKPPQDWLVILVKAFDTEKIAPALSFLSDEKTMVLTLQNGIGHEHQIKSMVKEENIVLGVTSQGATLLEEGVVRHAGVGPTFIGPCVYEPEKMKKIEAFAHLIEAAGWECTAVKDIQGKIWRKLLINVGINALTAILDLKNGALLEHKEALDIQKEAVTEAWHIMQKKEINLHMPLNAAVELVRMVCKTTSENISSMLQDRRKKSRTEIDFINGAIVREGQKLKIPAPVNKTLTNLVHLLSKH